MPFFFALAVFANAMLLFAVQPMVAKMVLPALGGTPAVWNTCMVFFQAALLAGYACAHAVATWVPFRIQTWVYPLVQLVVFAALPIALREDLIADVPHESNPIPWLLGTLLIVAGFPFFIVATTGPLLQRWFASSDHPAARDPYFLYAASNLGSMSALLSYPVLLEPSFTLAEQGRWWTVSYGGLVLLTFICSITARARQRRSSEQPARDTGNPDGDGGTAVSAVSDRRDAGLTYPLVWRRRLRWMTLAFVPSSLMLGVTAYLANDIGSIPLLWVIPLSLYLLSFILTFARRAIVPHRLVVKMVPPAVIALVILLFSDSMQPPVGVWVVLHLLVFFVLALFCHGELAADRPSAAHLTEFYLWLAIGGVLGGIFNALAAPLLFSRVLEYPLAVVFACLFRPSTARVADTKNQRLLDWILPAGLALLAVLLIVTVRDVGLKQNQIKIALMVGVPALVCYSFVDRPRRFALGIAGIFLAALVVDADPRGVPLLTERSFFGVLRVTAERDHNPSRFYQLVHGNTFHGRQRQNPSGCPEPLSYYHRSGPIGEVFRRLDERLVGANVGVIGLGVGAMASYAQPSQHWTFYEIDPTVKRVAENTDYFRFLSTCRAGDLKIELGDARLRLREARNHSFDVLVLDAFSSDSVPIHLLTREALQLYLSKLKPHGVLAFHISNRYLDLKPVLAALANDAGLVCRYCDDFNVLSDQEGKDPSQWVVMVRKQDDLGSLALSIRWFPTNDLSPTRVWTDDYSNILSIVRWRQSRED